ncbi:MAG: Crp/Fnr family transcriptional regulator [Gemmatimonadaceae bacterium]|nr:Crp/Fnr family transcriptional regulator [Gloeobacterales cyanobacterium ES-bin-141]
MKNAQIVNTLEALLSCDHSPPNYTVQRYGCRKPIPDGIVQGSVMLVKQGAVLEKVYLASPAHPVVRIVMAGEFLCSPRLLGLVAFTRSSVVRTIHLHGTTFHSWRNHPPETGSDLLMPQMGNWYRQTLYNSWQQLSELLHHSASFRLASLLLELTKAFGLAYKDGYTVLPLRLTIKDLADCIGTTRETASMSLTRLKRNNLVLTENHLFVVALEGLESYRAKL